MIKYFVLSLGLSVSCNMVCAQVTVMDNAELDSVVVETQREPLQPVLPQYDANGQIGAATALSVATSSLAGGFGATASTPTASAGGNGGIALQLPVSPITDMILNTSHNLNIPQNVAR